MLAIMKPVDPKHAARIIAVQLAFGDTNDQLAERFGVGVRTLLSWKYKERNPSKTALKLLDQLAKKAKLS